MKTNSFNDKISKFVVNNKKETTHEKTQATRFT